MTTFRVLLFGATGSGKTSLCNELTGQRMTANSSARGNTFETHTYKPFSRGGNTFVLTDTVGLNGPLKGSISHQEAASQLVNLLVEARDGFSMLVHVFRIPRVTGAHDENYEFFVNEMTQGKIPVILVATGCENEVPMSAWAKANNNVFRDSEYDYKEVVATCFVHGGPNEDRNAPLRRKSRSAVLKAIIQHGLNQPLPLYDVGDAAGFNNFITRIWNRFVALAGLDRKYRKKLNESGTALLIRLGVPRLVAESAAMHLPQLLEKGVDAGTVFILPAVLKPLAPALAGFIKTKVLRKK